MSYFVRHRTLRFRSGPRNMQNCLSPKAYSAFDAIPIAASLGGPAALVSVLERLPAGFPSAILIVQHMQGPLCEPLLHRLRECSGLPVELARDGEPVLGGIAYLAPPDRHLLVSAERRVTLERTSRVKFCRPSAEPLFASVAAAYRERALGVVLTGCNNDGAIGARTLKSLGGRVLAQDPASARAGGMPRAAIATGAVDFVLPVDKIGPALVALVMAPGVSDYLKVRRPAA